MRITDPFSKPEMIQRLKTVAIAICLVCSHSTNAADEVERAGDILQIAIPATALLSTFYLDDKVGRSSFYKSFATNIVITHALKQTIDKKRPSGSDHSFPSGHTSAAFQGAAFIHKRYGFSRSIPAYIGAAFVGYSRVATDHHFTEDVIAGALIGTASVTK